MVDTAYLQPPTIQFVSILANVILQSFYRIATEEYEDDIDLCYFRAANIIVRFL